MSAETGPEPRSAAGAATESSAAHSAASGDPGPVSGPAERRRLAADLVEQTAATTHDYVVDPWAGAVRDTLAPWVALMSPQLAGPLAAWLRAEADDADLLDAGNLPGGALDKAATVRALAVADVILGGAS